MSRWAKSEEDDRPLTDEEFEEMRLGYLREVRSLHARGWRWSVGPISMTKKASRRELRYLEKLEELRSAPALELAPTVRKLRP